MRNMRLKKVISSSSQSYTDCMGHSQDSNLDLTNFKVQVLITNYNELLLRHMSKGRTVIPVLTYLVTLDKSFYFCFFIYKTGTKNTFSKGIHVNGISESKQRNGIQGGFSSGDGILITYRGTDQMSTYMKNNERFLTAGEGNCKYGMEGRWNEFYCF